MSWTKSVFSSMVQEISWGDNVMTITYNNGNTYEYHGVPEDVALEGSKAPSVGQWVDTEVKGKYGYRKIG